MDPDKTSYITCASHNLIVFYKLLQDKIIKNHD